ncbi:MAG: hypothetical protein AAGA56_08375 [Myxococcota bacterium]
MMKISTFIMFTAPLVMWTANVSAADWSGTSASPGTTRAVSSTGRTSPEPLVEGVPLTFHVPFATTFAQVDPGYAFAADLVEAYVCSPRLAAPVALAAHEPRGLLLQPRVSFIPAVIDSTRRLGL